MTIELNYQYFQSREPKFLSIFPAEAKAFMECCVRARVDMERYQDSKENKQWIKFVEGLYSLFDECHALLTYFYASGDIERFIFKEIPHVSPDGRIFSLRKENQVLIIAGTLHSEKDITTRFDEKDLLQAPTSFINTRSHRQELLACFSVTFQVLAQMMRWVYASRRLYPINALKANEHVTTLAKAHNFPFSGQVPNPYDG